MGRAARSKRARRAAIRTTEVRRVACPACGATLDGTTGVAFGTTRGPIPKPGDVSMCVYCTTRLVFTDAMDLRLATAGELAALSAEAATLLEAFARRRRH